jgi:hypothetical protein
MGAARRGLFSFKLGRPGKELTCDFAPLRPTRYFSKPGREINPGFWQMAQ